VTALDEF
jgi:hypothetical protein